MDRSSTSSGDDLVCPSGASAATSVSATQEDTSVPPRVEMKQDKSRVPALLAALLSFTAMLLALRCWTLSNENIELETQASAVAEALQISATAQNSCAQSAAAAQRSEKRLTEELAKLRIQWEKLRGQVAQNKPRLEQGELCAAERKKCGEQLLASRQSEEANSDVIASLHTETQRLRNEAFGLVTCKEQLEQMQAQVSSKQSHGPSRVEFIEDNEAVHRDAIRRGAVGKRKKSSRPKKTRAHAIDEEPVEEVRMVEDDLPPNAMISDDEDAEVREVEADMESVEKVAAPRKHKSTSTTTTEIPLAADEVQEEVVVKSTTLGLKKMVRMVV